MNTLPSSNLMINNPKEVQDRVCRRLLIYAIIAFIVSAFCIYLLVIYENPSDTFWHRIGNMINYIILLPIITISGILSIYNLIRYTRYVSMSVDEWGHYIRTNKPIFSVATYRHPYNGDTRSVRRGFSLPVFIFGVFVPLFRGQGSLAFQYIAIILGIVFIGTIFPVIGNILGFFIGQYTYAFRYNQLYEKWLISNGYQFVSISM